MSGSVRLQHYILALEQRLGHPRFIGKHIQRRPGDLTRFKTMNDQFSLVTDSLVKMHPPSEPLARVQGTLHVLVLTSTSATLPPPPTAETAAPARPNRPARPDRPGVRSTAP